MFDRHDIFQFCPMNMEFPIFTMVTCQFQLSLGFFLVVFPLFSQYWYFGCRFGIVPVIEEPCPTNINQYSLMFSIEVFRIFFTSLGFF